jgi:hypothetical protein
MFCGLGIVFLCVCCDFGKPGNDLQCFRDPILKWTESCRTLSRLALFAAGRRPTRRTGAILQSLFDFDVRQLVRCLLVEVPSLGFKTSCAFIILVGSDLTIGELG